MHPRVPLHVQATDRDPPEQRAGALSAALEPLGIGPVEWVARTGSTNVDLLARAARGAPHGLVRIADHQSAGRGRRDRTWSTAPEAALLMSALVRVEAGSVAMATATAAMGLAIHDALGDLGLSGAGLKWPNDLVSTGPGQPKIAGVLAQSSVQGSGAALVIGVGINVRRDGLEALVPDREVAALADLGVAPDRVHLAAAILARFASWTPGDPVLWGRYRAASVTLGTRVTVTLDDGVVRGVADDVTDHGALVVLAAGRRHEIVAGDVVSLRDSPP